MGGPKRAAVSTSKNDEVWVPEEPREERVLWRGANKFAIVCCKDAFSREVKCKFAFCPTCGVKAREKVQTEGKSSNTGSYSRAKRIRGISKDGSRASQKTGSQNDKNKGGTCGKHTLNDILTVDYIETNPGYLKSKNESKVGSENIATNCVYCGLKF